MAPFDVECGIPSIGATRDALAARADNSTRRDEIYGILTMRARRTRVRLASDA
jgi:hypothetical protein